MPSIIVPTITTSVFSTIFFCRNSVSYEREEGLKLRGEKKICNFVFKLRADYVQVNCKMAIYVSLIIKYMFGNVLNVRMVCLAVMMLLSGYY